MPTPIFDCQLTKGSSPVSPTLRTQYAVFDQLPVRLDTPRWCVWGTHIDIVTQSLGRARREATRLVPGHHHRTLSVFTLSTQLNTHAWLCSQPVSAEQKPWYTMSPLAQAEWHRHGLCVFVGVRGPCQQAHAVALVCPLVRLPGNRLPTHTQHTH